MRSRRPLQLLPAAVLGLAFAAGGCTALADFPDYHLDVRVVAVGEDFNCIITNQDEAMCWGNGNAGQLGTGDGWGSDRPRHVLVEAVSQLVTGRSHGCALTLDETVYCWGDNLHFQIGDEAAGKYETPRRVTQLEAVEALYTGLTASCARRWTGEHFCWGDNVYLQLTSAVAEARSAAPVEITLPGVGIDALALGEGHVCALDEVGDVWCWGSNEHGQTGLGEQQSDAVPCVYPAQCVPLPRRISTLSEVTALSSFDLHTCALLQQGTIRCWGWNGSGQLGDGTTENRYTPAAPVVSPGGPWGQVATGHDHTCAIDVAGDLYCWGSNYHGQLGIDGVSPPQSTGPLRVAGLGDVKAVSLGSAHSCALVGEARDLYCWGRSGNGQIGYTNTDYLAPVAMDW